MTIDQYMTSHRQTALRSPGLFVLVTKHFCCVSGALDGILFLGFIMFW